MRNLVNILNTQDLRYLLDVNELPDNYPVEELVPVIDIIMREDEKLTGTNYYTSFFKTSDYAFRDRATLVAITGIQELILCGYHEEAEEQKKEWKLTGKKYDDLDLAAKRIIQKLDIENMKSLCKVCGGKESDNICDHCGGDGKEPKVIHSFGKMCANINYALKINPKDATVAEFREYEKMAKQLTAEKE